MRPLPLAAVVAAVLFSVSAGATPAATHRKTTARHVAAPSLSAAAAHFGRSVGSPTEGKLIGGVHIEETPYLRVLPSHRAGDVRWGLEPLVMALDRAARNVRRQFPDAVASLGHLSRPGGGEIDRHHSHESGRDADVAFYMKSRAGRPVLANDFVTFRGDGAAPHYAGAVFDDARNWAFIASLVTDPGARVSHVFIAAPLRARLLAYAEHTGVPHGVRVRAAELMVQPRGALPHDDHFHVRIGCPSRMQGCIEFPAMARTHVAKRPLHGRQRVNDARLAAPARPGHAAPARPGHPNTLPPQARQTAVESQSAPQGEPPAPLEADVPAASLNVPVDDVDGD